MKKGKIYLCLAAITSIVTSCGFDEVTGAGGEWGEGGIAFLPVLWSPTEEGDCRSIIQGWIDSCADHGITIKGHDNTNVQDAMNSQTWTVEFDSEAGFSFDQSNDEKLKEEALTKVQDSSKILFFMGY